MGRASGYWGSDRSFLSCWQHSVLSLRCLLSRLASLCLLVPGGRLRVHSPQLPLWESWDVPDEEVVWFLASADRVRPQVGVQVLGFFFFFPDNTPILAYICNQDATLSLVLNSAVQLRIQWAESHQVSLVPQFVMGSRTVVTDSLDCRNQGIESEWTLVQVVVDDLLQRCPATVVLFATSLLPAFGVFSSINDPMASATSTFLQSWDDLLAYDFPPFSLFREVLFKLMSSWNTPLPFVTPWWPQKVWFLDLQCLVIAPPVALPMLCDLLRQLHFHHHYLQLPVLQLHG